MTSTVSFTERHFIHWLIFLTERCKPRSGCPPEGSAWGACVLGAPLLLPQRRQTGSPGWAPAQPRTRFAFAGRGAGISALVAASSRPGAAPWPVTRVEALGAGAARPPWWPPAPGPHRRGPAFGPLPGGVPARRWEPTAPARRLPRRRDGRGLAQVSQEAGRRPSLSSTVWMPLDIFVWGAQVMAGDAEKGSGNLRAPPHPQPPSLPRAGIPGGNSLCFVCIGGQWLGTKAPCP